MKGLADRYADALADVSIAANVAPQIRQELAAFLELTRESNALRVLLENPTVARPGKRAVVEELAQRMGTSRILRNFLFVMIDRRRIALLPEIQGAFDAKLDERQGITRAEVTTAQELGAEERAHLRSVLERLTGKRVEPDFRLDPALIAGAVVRIGSTIYDGSVRAQIDRLRTQMVS